MKEKPFATEAALCAAFTAWVRREYPDVRIFAEWAGWDILLVYPEGWQIGIQAKLRLNAEVIGQAAPDTYFDHARGPDFRAVLVPDLNPLSGLASRLGLVVFYASQRYGHAEPNFHPGLRSNPGWGQRHDAVDRDWVDWNPPGRHDLPPTETDAVAGSPCPVTLTPWKLCALAVLAELATKGTIATKRMRALGVDPSRWLTYRWLVPGETRGLWIRGDDCPKFDEQHPSAYTLALAKARGEATA